MFRQIDGFFVWILWYNLVSCGDNIFLSIFLPDYDYKKYINLHL